MKGKLKQFLAIYLLLLGCSKEKQTSETLKTNTKIPPTKASSVPGVPAFFAMGADIGWLSQMEDEGQVFYDKNGVQKNCLDILKEQGVNSIRLRAWVNPDDKYCSTADVTSMAVRAKAKGFRIMIDLHYSDWWADVKNQRKPAAWSGHSFTQLMDDVYNYTYHVMDTLKANGVVPDWVQVGNETG